MRSHKTSPKQGSDKIELRPPSATVFILLVMMLNSTGRRGMSLEVAM